MFAIKYLLSLSIFILVFIAPRVVFGQIDTANELGVGISNYIPIQNFENIRAGDIIIREGNVYKRSYKEYQSGVIGVVVENPAIAVDPQVVGTSPVLMKGSAEVRVNDTNGEVLVGDFVTTSASEGIAMKMTQRGYGIGRVLRIEDSGFDENGEMMVLVGLDFSNTEINKESSSAVMFFKALYPRVSEARGTFKVVKYFVSGFILVLTIIFLAVNVKRISEEGIKALGRNPLASRPIYLNVLLNFFVTGLIGIAGFALSYLLMIL